MLSCLKKDPARRPQSAESLAEQLRKTVVYTEWSRESARGWWRSVREARPDRRACRVSGSSANPNPTLAVDWLARRPRVGAKVE